jgi:hypothetical protein
MKMRISIPVAVFTLLSAVHSVSLAQADSNSDERIKRLLQKSPQADANKDGVLTLKEAQAFLKEQRARQPNRSQARANVDAGQKT